MPSVAREALTSFVFRSWRPSAHSWVLRMFALLLACQAACGCRLRLEATGIDRFAAIRTFAVLALSQSLECGFDLPQFVAVALDFRRADLVDRPAAGQILGIGHSRARVGAVVNLAMLGQFRPQLRRALLKRLPDPLRLFMSQGVHDAILGFCAPPRIAPDQAKLRLCHVPATGEAVSSSRSARTAAPLRRDQYVARP
jgi:hypothetical protein